MSSLFLWNQSAELRAHKLQEDGEQMSETKQIMLTCAIGRQCNH
jgi:hypothetical protein